MPLFASPVAHTNRCTYHATPMLPVVIYTTPYCPYCLMAKRLLTKKGAAFQEIDVAGNPRLRQEMAVKAGGRTSVPQIWIGKTHVGGSDELYARRASSTHCWRDEPPVARRGPNGAAAAASVSPGGPDSAAADRGIVKPARP